MKTAQAIAGHTTIHPESMYIFLAPDCAVWIMVEVNVTYMLTPLQQYKMFMMFMNTSTGGEGEGGGLSPGTSTTMEGGRRTDQKPHQILTLRTQC